MLAKFRALGKWQGLAKDATQASSLINFCKLVGKLVCKLVSRVHVPPDKGENKGRSDCSDSTVEPSTQPTPKASKPKPQKAFLLPRREL